MAIINKTSLPRPIVTGAPGIAGGSNTAQQNQAGSTHSFVSVLQKQLQAGSSTAFSRHAVSRVMERQIDVSSENLQRLDQGMKIAQEKGLRDALILIDQNAFIVSVGAGKVITVDAKAQKGSVFTNIDGTVIV